MGGQQGVSHWGVIKWVKIIGLAGLLILFPINQVARADYSVPQADQTPNTPLNVPDPAASYPRYISGFGLDNSYTLFYEDRNSTKGCPADTFRIYFNKTINGPFGFSAASQATNICDSHFLAKDWPITIGANTYKYRAWGAGNYSGFHNFYVSNDMVNWTLVRTFTFNNPSDGILYGFHDIVQLNNHYIGFVESAGGHTYIVSSNTGDQYWAVVARIGGIGGNLPLDRLLLPGPNGPIPTGNFLLVQLDGQPAYVKLYEPGDRSAAYLMINRAAAQASNSAQAETAFLDPNNWTWRDGSIGLPLPDNAVLTSTLGSGSSGHDVRELWTVPTSSLLSNNVILYAATYNGAISHGLGCAASTTDCLVESIPPAPPTAPGNNNPSRSPKDSSKSSKNSSFSSNGSFIIPVTGFAPGKTTSLDPHMDYKLSSVKDIQMEIPALNIKIPILGAQLFNGEWDLSWLNYQAAYLDGTAFPTLSGNSVIAGHVVTADGNPGPFADLHSLRYGDNIILHAWGYKYLYEVREYRLVDPFDQYAFQHEDYSWITLTTCEGYDPSTGSYWWRRVVKAVEVNVVPDK